MTTTQDQYTQYAKEGVRDDPDGQGDGEGGGVRASRELRLRTIADIRAELALAGERQWLVEGMWPGDAYGVLGAQDKAGKTWALLDLAVSVAAGLPWFGRFPCTNPGTVVLFLGEGGMAGMIRRLDAVCHHKGVKLDDLPILLDFKVPNLAREEQVQVMERLLREHREDLRLVGIDPLYLAVGGKSGASLAEMGEVLAGPQAVCEDLGTALVVMSHWTKGGDGKGPERFTGAGPGAWGRVLGSAAVEGHTVEKDGKTTNVLLGWQFKGGEIPDTEFRIRRRVWAEDPKDINSPLFYETEVTDEGPTGQQGDALGKGSRRLLAILHWRGPDLTVKAVQEETAHDGQGPPLRMRTVENTLPKLEKDGLARGSDSLPGMARTWSVTDQGRAAVGLLDQDQEAVHGGEEEGGR